MKKIKAVRWGVWDNVDSCWLGDDFGPKLFDDKTLAQASCQLTAMQLGNDELRYSPKKFKNVKLKLKDEVLPRRSSLSALRILEGIVE